MPKIDSTRNDIVKLLKSLGSAKGRQERGLFLIEGEKLALEILAAKWPVALCLHDPLRCAELASRVEKMGADTYEASEAVLTAASTTKTPPGIVLAARIPPPARPEGITAPLLALDGIQDPGNVGTLLRSADATGFGGAILGAGCADAFAPKTIRSSMGAIFNLHVLRVDNLAGFLYSLRAKGWSIAATSPQGDDFFLRASMSSSRVLVIGSEGRGISPEVLAVCDWRFSLPMTGETESFNAAVAAGIMMYDWFRETLGDNERKK